MVQSQPVQPTQPVQVSQPAQTQVAGTTIKQNIQETKNVVNQTKKAPPDQVPGLLTTLEQKINQMSDLTRSMQMAQKAGQSANDHNGQEQLKKQIKQLVGEMWDMLSSEPTNDEPEKISVAGSCGSHTIYDLSVRGKKEKKDNVEKNQAIEKDILHGGVGDDVPDSELNQKELEMGVEVELEHTNNRDLAKEIARDHLGEELKDGKKKKDQKYYTNLKKIHEDKCSDVVPNPLRRNLDY